jgi:hypothetical protein
MGVKTEIENKGGYINFRVIGDYNGLDFDLDLKDAFGKVVESANRLNSTNVLLDIRKLDYKIDVLERYKIGEAISDIFRKNLIRIACLRCSDNNDDFAEVVANNRGAIFKFFAKEKDAIKWLKS